MRHRVLLVEYNRVIEARKLANGLCQAATIDPSLDSRRLQNPSAAVQAVIELKRTGLNVMDWRKDSDKAVAYAATILAAIEEKDPTPNRMYMQWLGRIYSIGMSSSSSMVMYEDLNRQERLTKYHRLKVTKKIKPEHADINRFKTYSQFEEAVEQYADPVDPNMAKGDADAVFKDSTVTVMWLHDEQSACYYGQGTRWCTAATKGQNMFSGYAQDHKLIAFLPRQPKHEREKYQIAVPKEDEIRELGGRVFDLQIMDEQDVPVSPEELLARFPAAFEALHAHPEFHYFFERSLVFWSDAQLQEAMRTVVAKLRPRVTTGLADLEQEYIPRKASEEEEDIDFDGSGRQVYRPTRDAIAKDVDYASRILDDVKTALESIFSTSVHEFRGLLLRHFGYYLGEFENPIVSLVYLYRNELDRILRPKSVGRPLNGRIGRLDVFKQVYRFFDHVATHFDDNPTGPLQMQWPDEYEYD